MRTHTDYLTFKTRQRQEIIDITDEVERCRDTAGIAEGMVLVSAMHISASVFVNDHEPGLWKDISTGSSRPSRRGTPNGIATTAGRGKTAGQGPQVETAVGHGTMTSWPIVRSAGAPRRCLPRPAVVAIPFGVHGATVCSSQSRMSFTNQVRGRSRRRRPRYASRHEHHALGDAGGIAQPLDLVGDVDDLLALPGLESEIVGMCSHGALNRMF